MLQHFAADAFSSRLIVFCNKSHTFNVAKFEGTDHGISAHYEFSIEVSSKKHKTHQPLLGKQACLEIPQGQYIHGVIQQVVLVGVRRQQDLLRIKLVSFMYGMTQQFHSRAWVKKTEAEIIRELLDADEHLCARYKIELTRTCYACDYIAQYQESDYDFLQRLLTRSGINTVFIQSKQTCQLLFFDDDRSLSVIKDADIQHVQLAGQCPPYTCCFNMIEESMALTGKSIQNRNKDRSTTRLMEEQQAWQRRQLIVYSNSRGIVPGMSLQHRGNLPSRYKRRYRVINVEHYANQTSEEGPAYYNKLLLISERTPYRKLQPKAAANYLNESDKAMQVRCVTPIKKYFYGVHLAKITSIDSKGMYRVRLEFDERNETEVAVTMLQSSVGSGNRRIQCGMHFPLSTGCEVAISYLDGNVDRPVILGAIPNRESQSPVNMNNRSQQILRTASGNSLLMEASHSGRKIVLASPKGQQLELSSKVVSLRAGKGEINITAKKTISMVCAGDYKQYIANNKNIISKDVQTIVTEEAGVALTSGNNVLLTADDNIQLENKHGDVMVKSSREVSINSDVDITMQCLQGDFKINSSSAKFTAAHNIVFSAEDTIYIGVGSASLSIKENGTLVFKGASATLIAAQININ